MQKEWKTKIDGRKWSTDKIESAILRSRGIVNLDRFLYPVEEDMIPFDKLKNIEGAAFAVVQGMKENKNFLVYYDSDT